MAARRLSASDNNYGGDEFNNDSHRHEQKQANARHLGIIGHNDNNATNFVPRDAARNSWPMMKQCSIREKK